MTDHNVDWELIGGMAKNSARSEAQALAQALIALEEHQTSLAMRLEDLRDREGFEVRSAALKAAREHVNGLPSEQRNERGYRDGATKAAERIALELQVADYLLGARNGSHPG